MRYSLIKIAGFLVFTTNLSAQINGMLYKESSSEAYSNVIIYKKGSTKRAITDQQGRFSIYANIGDTLVIKENHYVISKNPFILNISDKDKAVINIREIIVTPENRVKGFESIEIGKKELDFFRGSSNGDVLNGIPGLQLNNIRNEAGALDIGIRGLQGKGRVPIFIDGGLQSVHTDRGYQGSSDRTYIEMDLVKKVKIDKGASSNPIASGAIGGVVEMKTIETNDVVLPGNQFGIYLKTNLSNNSKFPKVGKTEKEQTLYEVQNRINESQFNSGNITFAFGYKSKRVDFISALSIHARGNFFAGKNGAHRYGYNPAFYDTFNEKHRDNYRKPVVRPSQEVVNTSYRSQSGLMKLGWNLSDHQRLNFNYRYHHQKAGELLLAYWYKEEKQEIIPQWAPGTARINSYVIEYKYAPNPTLDLNVSLFANTGYFKQYNGLPIFSGASYGDQYLHEYQNNRIGGNIYNKSVFTKIVPITLIYGLNLQRERNYPIRPREKKLGAGRNGIRHEAAAFISGKIQFNKISFEATVKSQKAKVYDYVSDRTIKYLPKLNVIGKLLYTPFNQLNIYAKASSVFRNPSLYESTESRQVMNYSPNYPLKKENTQSIELGFQTNFTKVFGADDQLTFMANGFYNNTKNYISPTSIKKDKYERNYVFLNYDKFLLKGVELNLDYNSPYMFFNSSAIFYAKPSVCSKIMGMDHNTGSCTPEGFSWSLLPSRIPPKQSFTLQAGVYAFDKKMVLGGRLKYHTLKGNPKGWLVGTGAGQSVAIKVPADAVLDLFGSYRLNEHCTFKISVDNVTNRYKYDVGTIISMPIPGRTTHVGVGVRF